MSKSEYIRPEVEVIHLPMGISLLTSFSFEAGFEEFEEGDEL